MNFFSLKVKMPKDVCTDCDSTDCPDNPKNPINVFKSNKININLGGTKMNKTIKSNQVTEAMLRTPGTLFYVGNKATKLVPGWRISFGDYAVCINDEHVPEGKWTKNLSGKLLAVVDKVILPQDTDAYRTLISELLCYKADADEDFDEYMFVVQDDVPFIEAVKAAKAGHNVAVEYMGTKTTFAIFIDTLRDIVNASIPTASQIAFGKWFVE